MSKCQCKNTVNNRKNNYVTTRIQLNYDSKTWTFQCSFKQNAKDHIILWGRVTTTGGTVLKGHSIRKVENHCYRRSLLMSKKYFKAFENKNLDIISYLFKVWMMVI